MAKTSIAGSNMTSTKFSLRFFRDETVNGRADLPDFFPVWLDIGEALAHLDAMPGRTASATWSSPRPSPTTA